MDKCFEISFFEASVSFYIRAFLSQSSGIQSNVLSYVLKKNLLFLYLNITAS